MNPTYHSDAVRFDDGNARVIEWAVRRRRTIGENWRDGARAELRDLLTDAREESWVAEDRARALAAASSPESTRSEVRTPSPSATPDVNVNPNPVAGGGSELGPCLAARQAPPALKLRAIETDCQGVSPREGPWLHLLRAEVYLTAGRLQDADVELRGANAQLAESPHGGAKPDAWALLAKLYRQRRWPTLAAAVAQYADPKTAQSFAEWYLTTRRRLAIPADAAPRGLAPTQEDEYLKSMERAEDAIAQHQPAVAEELMQKLAQAYPKLPGSKLVRCELELSRGRLTEAAASCDAVLRQQTDASSAHFLAGLIAGRRHQPKESIAHLRRAVELDPDTREAWLSLDAALRQAGDPTAAEKLAGKFAQHFGTPLK